MSAKVFEPNYTQVPNTILDALSEFSDLELRVILTVCRQTFGWHRDRAVMSISFLKKATGISNVSVIKACDSLAERGMIEKEKTTQRRGANAFRMVVSEPPKEVTPKAPDLLMGLTGDTKPPVNRVNNYLLTGLTPKGSPPVNRVNTNKETLPKEILKETAAEEIYQAYPLKVGRPQALKAILKASRKFPMAVLFDRTKAYAAARNGDTEFMPHPATWFNQERFNDDPSTWVRQNGFSKPKRQEPKEHVGDEF